MLITKTCHLLSRKIKGGISLANTVVVDSVFNENKDLWRHEFGHTRQSLYLGPLYLLVIGIPSLLWALYCRCKKGVSYYSFYTEKWADLLGGVKRK